MLSDPHSCSHCQSKPCLRTLLLHLQLVAAQSIPGSKGSPSHISGQRHAQPLQSEVFGQKFSISPSHSAVAHQLCLWAHSSQTGISLSSHHMWFISRKNNKNSRILQKQNRLQRQQIPDIAGVGTQFQQVLKRPFFGAGYVSVSLPSARFRWGVTHHCWFAF